MATFLILTVGGSHQPLLRSIESNQPDFVHFLCSDDAERTKGSYLQVEGTGNVLKSRLDLPKPDLPNIATMAKLEEGRFQIHKIKHFDNLEACYLASMSLIEDLHRHDDATVIVDYTGGTKSMTAGLAAAALDDGRCDIQVVAGMRDDLHKVTDQTEFVRPVKVWDAQTRRRMVAARDLIARYDYAGAVRMLEETSRRFASDGTIDKLRRWISFCRAFDAWDKFDHETARLLLQPYRDVFSTYKGFLAMLLDGKGHGFELVEDLLLNAERRAAQERFDDAIGRLYRSLELTAQVWLRKRYQIDTGNVQIEFVPESVQDQIRKEGNSRGVIKVGLILSWDILAATQEDPLGQLFSQERAHLLSFLTIRNESLFAHGQRAIRASDYHQHAPVIGSFLRRAIEGAITASGSKRHIHLDQLPKSWE